MTRHRKDTLRTLTEEERRVLGSIARARSEPASHVARAKILLAVADGATYQGAAYAAGRQSNDAVAQLVARFNTEGLAGQDPHSPEEIIAWLEATAHHWARHPTPFEWGGKRAVRRARSRQRRHALGGSGACTHRPIRRRPTIIEKWTHSCQMTH